MAEKRAIFEDVSGEKGTAPLAPKGGMIDKGQGGARLAIRAWIILLGVLVFAMIVVGGLTRLTDSGLSITEWRPLTGALPPLNEAHWLSEFEKYKQIPEFQLQNKWMDLHDFKVIYWWEWGHRQLGRVVGLVWAGWLSLVCFAAPNSDWMDAKTITSGRPRRATGCNRLVDGILWPYRLNDRCGKLQARNTSWPRVCDHWIYHVVCAVALAS
jgi:cytochrome c oxidase assembly protein subunit 15